MSLLAPWALLGLLALPVLLWLHRLLAEPRRTVLPSLLFFVEDAGALVRGERRRRDVDLWITLGAGLALGLAAAGPQWARGEPGRRVRVVVSGGAPAAQRGYDERVERALSPLRAALGPSDALEVVAWPGTGSVPERRGPRPLPAALAAAAQAGAPGLAVVVSDALPAEPPAGVRWIAVGDAALVNLAIVAADLEPLERGARLLVSVLNHGRATVRATVAARVPGAAADLVRREVLLGPDALEAVLEPLTEAPDALELSVRGDERDPGDALEADDRVLLLRRPFSWGGLEGAGQAALRRAVAAALEAVLGAPTQGPTPVPGSQADLWVEALPPGEASAPPGNRLRLVTDALPYARRRLAGQSVQVQPHALTRDLDLSGVDLVLALPPQPRGVPLLLARGAEGDAAVLTLEGTCVTLWADPLTGQPPLVDTPVWPLLLENVARFLGGEGAGPGLRRQGLLDPASSRLGRLAAALPPEVLAGVPLLHPPAPWNLRVPLCLAGLGLLLALWWRGARAWSVCAPAPTSRG